MGRSIGRGAPARPLGNASSNVVTASQPVPTIGTDITPGQPADSGYYLGASTPPQANTGPAQNWMGGGGVGMDNQEDPNLRLKQNPFFGNLY